MSDPLSKRRLKMWIRLLGVTRVAEAELREFLRVKHDTTLPRFDVMAALYRRREGVTMSELSRMLLVSNGNATAVVDRLEARGWLERKTAPEDRRARQLALTDAGDAYLQRVRTILHEIDDADFAALHAQVHARDGLNGFFAASEGDVQLADVDKCGCWRVRFHAATSEGLTVLCKRV